MSTANAVFYAIFIVPAVAASAWAYAVYRRRADRRDLFVSALAGAQVLGVTLIALEDLTNRRIPSLAHAIAALVGVALVLYGQLRNRRRPA